MASKVSIWNLALARIKVSALIQSETEGSTEANACLTMWEHTLKATLERFDWSFARTQVSLAELVEDPPPEWDYRYQYPSDCITARYLAVPVGTVVPYPFEVVLAASGDAKNILCNVSPATLVYTKDVENPALFSGVFVEAMSWKLGAEIGPQLGANAKRIDACEVAFARAIEGATLHDIQQAQNRSAGDAAHIVARE